LYNTRLEFGRLPKQEGFALRSETPAYMKSLLSFTLATVTGIALLGTAGCSKENTSTPNTTGSAATSKSIDTSRVQTAFQTAPPTDKSEVQSAVDAIKTGNYSAALAPLQKVASSLNLTPEQKSAVQDLIVQLQTRGTGMGTKAMGTISNTASQAGQGAASATNELQKLLSK
jgi:hypothetical protein